MTQLEAEGLALQVPSGWEGRIAGRPVPVDPTSPAASAAAEAGQRTAVLHAASFPLPAGVGDFGGGAVDVMRASDVFVALFEYGPESIGTAMFAAQGVPRLRIDDPHPMVLRKLIDGQSGIQRFFTAAGRPFCLYVVLGSHRRRARLVPLVNDVLRSLRVD